MCDIMLALTLITRLRCLPCQAYICLSIETVMLEYASPYRIIGQHMWLKNVSFVLNGMFACAHHNCSLLKRGRP